MTGGADDPILDRLNDRAALFPAMGTIPEPAFVDKRLKLPKASGQFFLANRLILFQLNGGKAGRIGHISTALDRVKFHLTGRMAASAEFLADGCCPQIKIGEQTIQKGRFSDTGVADKNTDLSSAKGSPLLHRVLHLSGSG